MTPERVPIPRIVGVRTTLRLQGSDLERMNELARDHDRTLSAEIRRAIRFYIGAQDQAKRHRQQANGH